MGAVVGCEITLFFVFCFLFCISQVNTFEKFFV